MDPTLYGQMRELEDRHWWFVGRRKIVASWLQAAALPAQARILDLGCGTGGNLVMLSHYGEVVGAELDDVAAQLARQRHLAPIVRARLPQAVPLAAESFDCVTMLDVLEHIADDAATLRTVHELLAPNGQLLLTVPAFPFLWGAHDVAHHHQRRYRADPLRALLQASGFEVQRLSYCNSWLFPPAAVVRLLRRWLGGEATTAGAELALPPAPLNRLLAALFASERHVLAHGRFPFGVSLIALARKAAA
jgi:SAM-dependent methyltransferase